MPKETTPGPLTTDQLTAKVDPSGSPSSVAVPARVEPFTGSVSVWSGPAFTVGGRFPVVTVIVTSLLALRTESDPVRRRTYVPAATNVADDVGEAGVPNVTAAGPITVLHRTLRVPPTGEPSSVTTPLRIAVLVVGRAMVCAGPALTVGGWFSA